MSIFPLQRKWGPPVVRNRGTGSSARLEMVATGSLDLRKNVSIYTESVGSQVTRNNARAKEAQELFVGLESVFTCKKQTFAKARPNVDSAAPTEL